MRRVALAALWLLERLWLMICLLAIGAFCILVVSTLAGEVAGPYAVPLAILFLLGPLLIPVVLALLHES